MKILKKIWWYITFQKDPNEKTTKDGYLKNMHFINRITIYMFILAIIIILFKIIK